MKKKKATPATSAQSKKPLPAADNHIRYGYLFFALACTAAVYILSALHNQFIAYNWDDNLYVTTNEAIQSWSFHNLFTTRVAGNWAPGHMALLMLEYHLFGLDPTGYHLASLALHLCNVALVFYIINKLTQKAIAAGAAALFFGIHPMHVESVAWVSAQKDLLYTFFYLAAMAQYCLYADKREQKRNGNIILALTLAFYILSCLSKAMGITLPAILVLIDCYRARNWNWKFIGQNIIAKIPFLIISFAFGIIAYLAQKDYGAADIAALDKNLHHTTAGQLMFACYGLTTYLVKFVLPFRLSTFYPYPLKDSSGAYPFVFYLNAAGVIIIAAFCIWWSIRKADKLQRNPLLFGLLFFLANVAMVLQLKTVGYAMLAERYSYLSYFGLLFAAAAGFNSLMEKSGAQMKLALMGGVCVLALVFGISAYSQCAVWENGVSLWTEVADRYPPDAEVWCANLFLVYNNLGQAYSVQGKTDSALILLNKSIALNAQYPDVYFNRGIVFSARGQNDLALNDYNRAVAMGLHTAELYSNRGNVYASLNKQGQAIADYDTAIAIRPKDADAFNNRGLVYASMGKAEQALNDYDTAIALNPRSAEAFGNRAIIYYTHGNLAPAVSDYSMAIALNPNFADAYNNRGIAYAAMGEYDLAIADYNAALKLNPGSKRAYANREEAYRLKANAKR